MRIAALIALLAVAGISAPGGEARADCNVRGQFCGYPNWASNVFAGRHRVPESTLPPDTVRSYDRPQRQRYRNRR
jgi:hypothetical protein